MIKPKKVFQKSLSEIAQYLNLEANFDLKINGIASNSAELEAGDLFVALSGSHTHGAKFIESALQAGAAAVLTNSEGAEITNQKLLFLTPKSCFAPKTTQPESAKHCCWDPTPTPQTVFGDPPPKKTQK